MTEPPVQTYQVRMASGATFRWVGDPTVLDASTLDDVAGHPFLVCASGTLLNVALIEFMAPVG